MIPQRLLRRTTVKQLREAIRLKKRLDRITSLEKLRDRHVRETRKLERRIARLAGSNGVKSAPLPRRRRRFSAETRRKMAESQRKRWEKARAKR